MRREWRIVTGYLRNHIGRQNDISFFNRLIVQFNCIFETKHIDFSWRFDPYNEIRTTSSNHCRLRLHPETLIFKALQGFCNETRLSNEQRKQAGTPLFFGVIQIFRNFKRRVRREPDMAAICKNDFRNTIGFRVPFVMQKYGIAHFRGFFLTVSFNLYNTGKRADLSDRFTCPYRSIRRHHQKGCYQRH